MSIATTVRDSRKALALTQRELAELAGTSERFVREVESGKATVRLDKLGSLLDVLGLDLALVERTPERFR